MLKLNRTAAVLVCAALGLTAAGCKRAQPDEGAPMLVQNGALLEAPAGSPLRTHLVVQPVGGEAAARRLDVPSIVEADPALVVNIVAPLTGRVTALDVALGDRVRRGQVLAVIASGDMAQANSDVGKAEDAFTTADKALTRAKGVQQAGGAATKDLEAAQSAYNQARSELDRAHARQTALNGPGGHPVGEIVLTAPRDGVVTALSIGRGAQVSDPTATLMTVTNIERVYVTANVPEDEIGLVSRGAAADIQLAAYPGQVMHGTVTEVNAVVESDTHRQKVRVLLENPGGRLMPNMYATTTFTLAPAAGGSGAVFVPQSALLMNNDQISVMVEVRPWVFERRIVKIGDETDSAARVLSGLAPGERVVVKGGVLLND
jgi:cobalt-zinc-cadmium efflux system membrane fusion protein